MEIFGFWELTLNLFLPVFPPFDVLPLRARLGLAHPTGLNTLPKARCWFPTRCHSIAK
jgi:hypothetical protein